MTGFRRIFVLVSVALLLTAGLAWGEDPIKVGAVLRLSVGSEHGIPSRRGVELAVDEVNKAGGINGRKVELIVEDEKDSPAAAVNAVQKLINVDKVVAIVGPMTSGSMMAAGKIADNAKVVAISPTATTPKLSGYGASLCRGCSRIDKQAEVLTDYVAKNWKPKTAGIFFSNEPYGKGCAQLFGEFFEKRGIKVVATESFNRGSRDFKSELTKIKAANPDILFIPGYTPETAPAAAQARQLGMNQKILGVYGDMDPVYIQLAGKAAEGHVIGGEYDEGYNTPRNEAFKKNYEALVKKNNDPYNIMFAALHYDAASVLLAGMKKNGPTSEGIRKFLKEAKDFDGVTGKLSFDENNDVVRAGSKGIYVLEVKNGKYVKVE
ncbi:MAG: ABC transporter substrate-binding protein [Desulfobaccales bacterium]